MADKGGFKIRPVKVALMGIGMVFVGVGFLAGSIYFYGYQRTVQKASAAIVLGASVWGNEPSPVFQERINHAIELYNNNQVEMIILTGGSAVPNEPADSIIAKNYVVKKGVPEPDILTETQSRTTFQNLYYAKQEAEAYKLKSFIIVSDPLHLKRAVVMGEDLGMIVYASGTPTTRYQSLKSQLEFLSRETFFYGLYLGSRLFVSPVDNVSKF